MDDCFLLRLNSTAQGQIQATSDEALCVGPAAAQWLRRCATSRNVPGSIPRRGIFFFRSIRQVSGVDSASKNEYQDIPGGKGGRCVGVTTLPPSCVMKSGSLNLLDPSRPVMWILYLFPFGVSRTMMELVLTRIHTYDCRGILYFGSKSTEDLFVLPIS